MRRILPWLSSLLIGYSVSMSGCSLKSTYTPRAFSVRYLSSTECTYHEITVNNRTLTHTHFIDAEQRCARWVQNTPCWDYKDLVSTTRTLSLSEWQTLVRLVETNGVFNLNNKRLGGAQTGQRYYAQHLSIHLDQQQATLLYQNFPEALPKPLAFSSLEQALQHYVQGL